MEYFEVGRWCGLYALVLFWRFPLLSFHFHHIVLSGQVSMANSSVHFYPCFICCFFLSFFHSMRRIAFWRLVHHFLFTVRFASTHPPTGSTFLISVFIFLLFVSAFLIFSLVRPGLYGGRTQDHNIGMTKKETKKRRTLLSLAGEPDTHLYFIIS